MLKKTNNAMRAPLALFAAFALGLTTAFAVEDTATNRPPVQTFYLPIPEEDLLQTLTSIHGGASWTLPAEPIESYNSIVVFVDGTVIYYDQWEDGYEQDIANPNHIYSAANALDAFEDYIPVDGEGNEDLGFCRMEATPPFNTVTINLGGSGARFFKIRVDNLADEVR